MYTKIANILQKLYVLQNISNIYAYLGERIDLMGEIKF